MSYRVLLADPPWQYRVWKGDHGRRTAESFYPTLSLTELRTVPAGQWAVEDCALFLWVTSPCLPEGLEVMKAWGFEYKTVVFVWSKLTRTGKPFFGMGHYTHADTELCPLGIRGSMPVRVRNVRQTIQAPVRDHSRKPDEQYARIMALYDGPYLELFARQRWPGWDAWGDEAPKENAA
jgi:N6-adenosine-specific RNA methylase IME4